MASFHTIKAQLHDNALTENPNDQVARVVSERSLNIVDICPSELMIITPELPKGTCLIEVVTQFSGTTVLKEPRTALFDKPLTVD